MNRRFGGVLSLVLGMVLIVGGGLGMNDATGGDQQPTCQPLTNNAVGGVGPVQDSCPDGTLSVTEVTKPDGTTGGPWQITITSPNCTTPGGTDVDQQFTVPNDNTHDSTQQLFVFADPQHTAKCTYHVVEAAVAGFTTTYDPGQNVTIPYDGNPDTPDVGDVTVTNTKTVQSSSARSSSSSAPSSSASEAPVAAASSSAAPLANTGPHSQISFSLLTGIALCLLGLVLLFAGRLPIPLRTRGKRN